MLKYAECDPRVKITNPIDRAICSRLKNKISFLASEYGSVKRRSERTFPRNTARLVLAYLAQRLLTLLMQAGW